MDTVLTETRLALLADSQGNEAVPNDDAMPTFFPPLRLRASTYNIPGPGAIASKNAAERNIRKFPLVITSAPHRIEQLPLV